jgi:hypothetical protein
VLALSGRLRLSNGPNGLRAGPFVASIGAVLLPGVSEPVTITLASSIPRGPWRADLQVSSGPLQRVASATISFPSRVGTREPSVFNRFRGLLSIGGTLVLLAILVWAVLARRRRRRSLRATATT